MDLLSEKYPKPHQVQLDTGEWVQIAAVPDDECGAVSKQDWSCSRMKNHDGDHVACTVYDTGFLAGHPDAVVEVFHLVKRRS